ncbi:MAG: sortase [Kineosporiaceae bacterium]
MTRWAGSVLAGLGAYGLTMGATGVALVVGPVASPPPVEPVSATAPAVVEPEPSPVAERPIAVPTPTRTVVISGVPAARRATAAAGQRTTFVPTRLLMPSGTLAPVEQADVAADGSLQIPDPPNVVGVWSGGAHAGDPFGSMVIAGHVDSAQYGLGVLAELKWVKPGAVIELQAGRSRMRYKVTRTTQVNQQSLATDDEYFAQGNTPHRLVVITCGGPFDRSKHGYRDNFIVIASPIS